MLSNRQISKNLKNILYTGISQDKLDTFFSTGYPRVLKERCYNGYNMYDYKQGILEANSCVRIDQNRHTVDLMLFALGKIEDQEKTISDLEQTIRELEKDIANETKQEIEEDTKSENTEEIESKGSEQNE